MLGDTHRSLSVSLKSAEDAAHREICAWETPTEIMWGKKKKLFTIKDELQVQQHWSNICK